MTKSSPEQFTQIDGHQLAVDMLAEIGEHWHSREEGVPDDQISDLWRRDDSAILRRYLETVRAHASGELERGFLAVLTDFIGGAAKDGSVPDLVTYERADPRIGARKPDPPARG